MNILIKKISVYISSFLIGMMIMCVYTITYIDNFMYKSYYNVIIYNKYISFIALFKSYSY